MVTLPEVKQIVGVEVDRAVVVLLEATGELALRQYPQLAAYPEGGALPVGGVDARSSIERLVLRASEAVGIVKVDAPVLERL